ncbi:MAG TPA: xanthine dehydrogenase family protein molybdopterin-binding subunit [Candidatus Acidoferrales bacterium]|nr:xanthine dehydrogenase family protein molybdopterin-binding subunit [Candidatus Acidoferrales bacterium]
MSGGSGQWKGRALRPREDERFVTGRGLYLANLNLPRSLHAAILRSVHPHARIISVDASEALKLPGVACVLTGEQAKAISRPLRSLIPLPVEVPHYCLAHDKVRYVGEPVAAVAATSRYIAEDALEKIRVEYEPLPAAVDPEKSMAPGAPILYESLGSNVLWHDCFDYGEVDRVFAQAAHVLTERFFIQRYSSTPLETFGCIANYDDARSYLTLWTNDQRPGQAMPIIAHSLGLSAAQIRFITADIGGGFGNKRKPPYLVLTALLSKLSGRPVQFIEDRRENLMALVHACNGVMDVSVAVAEDGTLVGLKVRDIADEGANLLNPTVHSLLKLGNITNCYGIRAVRFDGYSVVTNKCPSGANRGIGKPFMCFALERMMDSVARRLGRDRIELREKNLLPPESMPYTTPTGALIDSGNFPATLKKLLEIADYRSFKEEQKRARAEGRWLGFGLAIAVEPSTSNQSAYILTTKRRAASGAGEAAMVRVESDGSVQVVLGDVGSGQGHQTAAAQIVADELGVPFDEVQVSPYFDSLVSPWMYTTGNYSNKFAGTDVGAIQGAARKVKEKLLDLGAHLLGVPRETLELADGAVRSRSDPQRRKTLAELAHVAYRDLLALPAAMEPGLEGRYYYRPALADLPDDERRVRNQLFVSNAAHAAIVEVDVETGKVSILKYAIVHDCGTVLNPLIVEGLVHGATAHGIGAALYEEFAYDEQGQLLTTTFVDYLKPSAMEIPDFKNDHLESPSPFTPFGMKGVGEGGAIPAPAAIANAVDDALAPLGVRLTHLPLTPERVWKAIQSAQGKT